MVWQVTCNNLRGIKVIFIRKNVILKHHEYSVEIDDIFINYVIILTTMPLDIFFFFGHFLSERNLAIYCQSYAVKRPCILDLDSFRFES